MNRALSIASLVLSIAALVIAISGKFNSAPVKPVPLTEFGRLEERAYAGDRKAQFDLASAYRMGQGCPRNPVLSYAWEAIWIGGEPNHREQVQWEKLNRENRTSTEIAEGERLAAELFQKVKH